MGEYAGDRGAVKRARRGGGFVHDRGEHDVRHRVTLLEELDNDVKGPGGISGFVLEPVEWHKDARCAELDVDPEWFYVERGQSPSKALQVCAQCFVRDECLDYALNDRDAMAFGVWGGTTANQRRAMKRAAVRLGGLVPIWSPFGPH